MPDGLVMVGCGGGHAYCHGDVFVSSDGTAWDRVMDYTGGRPLTLHDVTASEGFLVAVGEEHNEMSDHAWGIVWESADGGSTWAPIGNPDSVFGNFNHGVSGLKRISNHRDEYIAVGYTGALTADWPGEADCAVWIGTIEN